MRSFKRATLGQIIFMLNISELRFKNHQKHVFKIRMSTLISKEPVCFHIDFRHRNVYLDFLNIKYTGTDQILESKAQLCKVKWMEVYFITLSKTILLKVPFENKGKTHLSTPFCYWSWVQLKYLQWLCLQPERWWCIPCQLFESSTVNHQRKFPFPHVCSIGYV